MNEAGERLGLLEELWGSQETAPIEPDLSRLRTEAERLDTGVRKRNRRENLAAVVVTGWFLLIAVVEAVDGNSVSAGGALLVCASALWVRFAIRRWGRSSLTPEDLKKDGQRFLALYRSELVRQRRFVLHAWLWYVLPISAGLFVLDRGSGLDRGESLEAWLGSFMFLALVAVTLAVVVLNLVAAWGLQRQIVELRSVEEV